ncbi:hypothetical protein IWX47DRAFT_429431 [Phyllosticta citricarpa]|uniref:Uncharacterized protein n=1 Tax=Phyllosticta citricarpa TaxID=55181 RepID=A0ABR1MU97_9PEZI
MPYYHHPTPRAATGSDRGERAWLMWMSGARKQSSTHGTVEWNHADGSLNMEAKIDSPNQPASQPEKYDVGGLFLILLFFLAGRRRRRRRRVLLLLVTKTHQPTNQPTNQPSTAARFKKPFWPPRAAAFVKGFSSFCYRRMLLVFVFVFVACRLLHVFFVFLPRFGLLLLLLA